MIRSIVRAVLIILGVLVVAAVLYQCVSTSSLTQTQSSAPLSVNSIVPKSWTVLTDEGVSCDFDGDGAAESMVVFRYDSSTYGPQDSLAHSQIGGVIYDSQVNRVPGSPGEQSPSRPALLIPYSLLPDVYSGKGQGYLGEGDEQVYLYKVGGSQTCASPEFAVLGTATGTLPSSQPAFLSVFRWEGESTGYAGVHYVGNARVAIEDPSKPILAFQTYNRLNDRSVLCSVQSYSRPAGTREDVVPPTIDFTEDAASYTIDFCFNAPGDPYHPEGVVVALLRADNPSSPDDPTPTGNSFLTPAAQQELPPELASLASPNRAPIPVLSVNVPGSVAPAQGEGQPCVPAQTVATASPQWWCGRERARVETEILLSGQRRQALWTLISMASSATTSSVHWRVENVELR
jgi:hypothetical protein